ncbi:hypothetical protein B0H11DRAFT_2375512 [Mycena galericulata]|nr:hypothetical protein B0H11DRAFT_2375512 [Mycena galericulata]
MWETWRYCEALGLCNNRASFSGEKMLSHLQVIGRLFTEYCGLCERKNERRGPNTNASGPETVQQQVSVQQVQNPLTSGVRNIGQFHRAQWRDAANFNASSIKAQQSTVAITGANMATLKSNNLATNECFVFVLEPFVNSKACEFLPTFEVIREGAIKFSDIVANGIASFNSSWEDASESSLVRSDMRLSRMNNVHLEIEPQSSFRDIFLATLKDCGQNLDKTVPTKFRNRKFATLYMEAHIDVAKFHSRTGVPPPPGLFKSKKRVWNENNSVSLGSSVLKRTRLASGGIHHLKSSFDKGCDNMLAADWRAGHREMCKELRTFQLPKGNPETLSTRGKCFLRELLTEDYFMRLVPISVREVLFMYEHPGEPFHTTFAYSDAGDVQVEIQRIADLKRSKVWDAAMEAHLARVERSEGRMHFHLVLIFEGQRFRRIVFPRTDTSRLRDGLRRIAQLIPPGKTANQVLPQVRKDVDAFVREVEQTMVVIH